MVNQPLVVREDSYRASYRRSQLRRTEANAEAPVVEGHRMSTGRNFKNSMIVYPPPVRDAIPSVPGSNAVPPEELRTRAIPIATEQAGDCRGATRGGTCGFAYLRGSDTPGEYTTTPCAGQKDLVAVPPARLGSTRKLFSAESSLGLRWFSNPPIASALSV
jgi:hypothetical protein